MEKKLSIRKPVVAGKFYPAHPEKLIDQINELVEIERDKIKVELATLDIIGGIVPHAGYIYSGPEAVHFFELVRLSEKRYDTIVILNPDHLGYSPEFATSPHDEWETPIGRLLLDKQLGDFFPQSEFAHSEEHSAEVMLPLIQIILGSKIKILPISIGSPTPETTKKLANTIFRAAKETNRKILLIASSDFSHYVTPHEGERLDKMVIEKILSLDSQGVYNTIRKNGITVCGYGPIMTLIEYSLLFSKSPKVTIAAKGNSGKSSAANRVVDYVTIIFSA